MKLLSSTIPVKSVCIILLAILFSGFISPAFSQPPKEWTYVVQPGDNLWNLSKKHLKSLKYWKQLVERNNIDDPYNLPPGKELFFPVEWLKSGASVATIVDFQGDIMVVREGENTENKVDINTLLWSGDVIKTPAGSNVTLQFADGSQMLVQESSEMQFDSIMSYAATGMARTKAKLKQGRTHNKVIPKTGPGSRFEITTPSAIAAVRGTVYRISADPDGLTRTEVLKGAVGVNSGASKRIVQSGYGTISSLSEGSTAPIKLLSAPDTSLFPETVRRVPFSLRVNPIENAVEYRLQIASDANFTSLIVDNVSPTGNLWGPDIPDGEYHLRIHGIDKQGLEGMDSIHKFTVAAHPVPPMLISPAEEAVLFDAPPVFKWSRPKNGHKFKLELSKDKDFISSSVDRQENLKKTFFNFPENLSTGVYYWRMASVNKAGKTGPFSDPQQFRRSPSSPDMEDAQLNEDSMTFRWRASEEGHAFRCQLSKLEDFSEILNQVDTVEPSYNMENYTPGTYLIRVALIDTDGYVGPYGPHQTIEIPEEPLHPLLFILPMALTLLIAL